MLRMDQIHVVRHKVLVEKQSVRAVARELKMSRNTVRKYVGSSDREYKQSKPRSPIPPLAYHHSSRIIGISSSRFERPR